MLTEHQLCSLRTLLSGKQVFTDTATLVAYEADAGLDRGRPEAVVFPHTREDVVGLVRWALRHHVPLIARGAGTGLSGGAVADRGGVIVEFVHLNSIEEIDPRGRTAVVEPALINLRLDECARTYGLYFPPDPSSQRASTIGGNVAENSGGPHCFKYGVTTNYISGLRVVLADGSTIRVGGRALDYPEYDLCGLITGSEGTLALISSIMVRFLRNPPGVKTLLAVFDTIEQAGEAVSAVITAGLVPATMELMDQRIIRIIEPFARAGLPLDAGAVMIVEVDGFAASLDAQINEIMAILKRYGGYDMRVARDEEERRKIWVARKSAAGSIAREVPAYYTVDITVPRSRLATILADINQIVDRLDLRVGYMAHAGDGNLHPLILIPDPDDPRLFERVHQSGREMVQRCVEMDGSLTGEHGIGIEKREYMPMMHKPADLLAHWDIKQAFDPAGLFNPGKLFPVPGPDESGPYAGYEPYSWQAAAADAILPAGDVFAPSTPQEAARGLVALAREEKPVLICSARGTAKIRMSTEKLRGILSYAPDDLYITVGAGTPLTEVQQFLAQKNQQLAMAAPWSDATVGGLVAANVNSPQRMRYGAVRDLVLCATVVLADGRVIRTGRPIVKNVAGYDLTKAFVGSYGTLGLLTDLSLKIAARPRASRTVMIPFEELAPGLELSQQLLAVALNASAIVLYHGYRVTGLPESRYVLAYTIEGLQEDVQAELEQVYERLHMAGCSTVQEVDQVTGTSIWSQIAGLGEADSALLVRAAVPVKDVAEYVMLQSSQLADGPWLADMASGHVYAVRETSGDGVAVSSWLRTLRTSALVLGGYAIVMDMPEMLSAQDRLDRWGYRPEGLKIMQRLKARWDPQGILNPGVFQVDR